MRHRRYSVGEILVALAIVILIVCLAVPLVWHSILKPLLNALGFT